MNALEAIMTRRSIRSFTGEPITAEEIDTVLRAAMAAPSAHNGRPWRFVLVRDREQLRRLSRCTLYAKSMATAEAGIVVCADRRSVTSAGFWTIDCSAAIQNALLAAHAQGLGGLWIGVHPIAPFAAAVRKVIAAPRTIAIHSMIALGRPARPKHPVDRYEPEWLHAERW